MNPEMTADVLVQLAHRYHPAGLRNDDPRYRTSEEGQRLIAVLNANVQPSPAWKGFMQQLREEFPKCNLWDTTVPLLDPCYSVRVSLPGFVIGASLYDCIVCLLSQLAPVYVLYASHTQRKSPDFPQGEYWLRFPPFPPEFQAQEARLAGLIESTFRFTRLSEDILFTPVPDLVPRAANYGPGEAQLIDCLFSPERW